VSHMKNMHAGVAVLLCAGVLLPAALGQVQYDYTWEENGNTIELSEGAVVNAAQFRQFKATGFTSFGVQNPDGRDISTITFPDSFAPNIENSGFEFALEQIPQGDPRMRTLPAGVNEDYLLSDLLVVSIRAKAGDPIALTTFQVAGTRVRDPDAPLPIPSTVEERFGKVTYETGKRRDFIDVPLGCPAGFEYRMVRVDVAQPLSRANACNCPAACSSAAASCDFQGSGRFAIMPVPEWTCETDVSTPVPRNEDDPLNENAAIAAGVILSTLFLCCMVIACMLCINSGPKDDHWNHAPRAPGAIPLPPDYKLEEGKAEPEEPVKNPDAPKAPARILPDGNPHPYNISAPAMPPPPAGAGDAPRLMGDPRVPAPNLASPPLPEPF